MRRPLKRRKGGPQRWRATCAPCSASVVGTCARVTDWAVDHVRADVEHRSRIGRARSGETYTITTRAHAVSLTPEPARARSAEG